MPNAKAALIVAAARAAAADRRSSTIARVIATGIDTIGDVPGV